jgi:uracil-DNA glycosylase family 4
MENAESGGHMNSRTRVRAAIDALAFQAEAGVDVALAEAPINRFEDRHAESPVERTSAPPREVPPITPATIAPALPAAEEAVYAARELAKSAGTLEQLQSALARFEGCALRFTAKQLVFADGNPNARVMFVGEAPGAEEDREGLPFVGRAGKLLDRMLASIGLDRTQVYIANIVPWRPPGNRTPTPQESAICYPFIRRQIELANPDFLVCLGRPSMQTLLGIKDGIRGIRGRWFDFDTGTRTIRALVSFHPAYLLRSPLEKRHSWRDMLALKKALDG